MKGNAAFDQFYLSQVPYIASALKSEELVNPALIALLEKIGPSVVMTHSHAGVFGWAASDQRPDLVKAHVAIEPNGPTFYDIKFKGGEEWYERVGEARARPYGITRVPLHFEPPVGSPADLERLTEPFDLVEGDETGREAGYDPPPLKWSALWYGF